MPIRHLRRTFLLVAQGGYPIAVLLGLPRPDRIPRAGQGQVLVYDLGRLGADEHARLVDALATLRELPYLAEGAPSVLLVGGSPAMVVDHDRKASRLRDLLRTL
jgi:hypothetical protein